MTDDEKKDEIVDAADLVAMMDETRLHAERIFVRAVRDGKYASLAMTELTAPQAIGFCFELVERWLANPGYRPVRLRTEEEMAKDEKG